jgi:hypothetical protein
MVSLRLFTPVLMLAMSAGAPSPTAAAATVGHSLYQSRQLWATVDVCNAKDQPNTIGIRGSMPGETGNPKDAMYVRFRLQYLNTSTHRWIDLVSNANSGWQLMGSAKSTRQTGWSFQLGPVAGTPAFTLRGVAEFQWRRGARVVHAVNRPTAAGHTSLAGADPAGFSAATCTIG